MKITTYKKQGKNHYKFQIRLGDKVTRRSGFKTKNEAIYAYTQLLEDYNNQIDGNLLFDDAFNEWLKVYQTKVKETTYENTMLIYKNHILPVFQDMRLKDITPDLCQKFALSLSNYVKGKTIFNYAKSVMDYGVKIYNLPSNPFEKVLLPNFKQSRKRIDFLEADEAASLINYYKDKLEWHTIFRILIYGGLRRGELLALEWQDINFTDSQITINKSIGVGENQKVILTSPKNKNSIRTIDMDQETMLGLKELKLRSQSNIVFTNTTQNYKRLSDIDRKLKKALKHLGLKPIRVHDLRHTHASLLFASGADMKYVQQRLGHARIETTMNIYTHVTKHKRKENLSNFVKYMESQA